MRGKRTPLKSLTDPELVGKPKSGNLFPKGINVGPKEGGEFNPKEGSE